MFSNKLNLPRFILITSFIVVQIESLEELPVVEDNYIEYAEKVIRDTVNNLFAAFKFNKVQHGPRLKQFSSIHNFFASITLQDCGSLKEIVRLTRVSGVDSNTVAFITQINEVLNEGDNDSEAYDYNNVYVGRHIQKFIKILQYLKNKYVPDGNVFIKPGILKYLHHKGSPFINTTNYIRIRHETPENSNNVLSDNEFWQPKSRRIFGGIRTGIKHFPFMASIHFFNQFQCAGSIIQGDLVITSSSCLQLAWNNRFFRENPAFLSVQVGSDKYNGGGEVIHVIEIHFHPEYNSKNLQNNIAILRLSRTIIFRKKNKKVKKIAFDKNPWNMPVNVGKVTVVGWGAKSENNIIGDVFANVLSYDLLDVYPLIDCQNHYTKEFVTEKHFCAGFYSKGSGACNRDAGGPGIVDGVLIGVISFGSAICGAIDSPTVFTKLGHYVDWIETIMKKPKVRQGKSTTTRAPRSTYTVYFKPKPATHSRFKMLPISRTNSTSTQKPQHLRISNDLDFQNFLKNIFNNQEDNEFEKDNDDMNKYIGYKSNKESITKTSVENVDESIEVITTNRTQPINLDKPNSDKSQAIFKPELKVDYESDKILHTMSLNYSNEFITTKTTKARNINKNGPRYPYKNLASIEMIAKPVLNVEYDNRLSPKITVNNFEESIGVTTKKTPYVKNLIKNFLRYPSINSNSIEVITKRDLNVEYESDNKPLPIMTDFEKSIEVTTKKTSKGKHLIKTVPGHPSTNSDSIEVITKPDLNVEYEGVNEPKSKITVINFKKSILGITKQTPKVRHLIKKSNKIKEIVNPELNVEYESDKEPLPKMPLKNVEDSFEAFTKKTTKARHSNKHLLRYSSMNSDKTEELVKAELNFEYENSKEPLPKMSIKNVDESNEVITKMTTKARHLIKNVLQYPSTNSDKTEEFVKDELNFEYENDKEPLPKMSIKSVDESNEVITKKKKNIIRYLSTNSDKTEELVKAELNFEYENDKEPFPKMSFKDVDESNEVITKNTKDMLRYPTTKSDKTEELVKDELNFEYEYDNERLPKMSIKNVDESNEVITKKTTEGRHSIKNVLRYPSRNSDKTEELVKDELNFEYENDKEPLPEMFIKNVDESNEVITKKTTKGRHSIKNVLRYPSKNTDKTIKNIKPELTHNTENFSGKVDDPVDKSLEAGISNIIDNLDIDNILETESKFFKNDTLSKDKKSLMKKFTSASGESKNKIAFNQVKIVDYLFSLYENQGDNNVQGSNKSNESYSAAKNNNTVKLDPLDPSVFAELIAFAVAEEEKKLKSRDSM